MIVKKNYIRPQVDMVKWEKADVITTSSPHTEVKVVDDVSVMNDTNVTVDADYDMLK